MEVLATVLKDNFWKFDKFIVIAAIINFICYLWVRINTKIIYNYFNKVDRISNLPEKTKDKLKKKAEGEKKLSREKLLDIREKMNQGYAVYSNLTTMFPLLGMLGTVCALIPMVNTIGTTDTSNFFSALTSTFWGIIAAMIFKLLDATISYKIEENVKQTDHLLFEE